MAAYVALDAAEVEAFLTGYGVGPLEALEPIAEGIENTNYRVRAGGRTYVLTLSEGGSAEEVASTLRLMEELAERGVPCPQPLRGAGGLLGRLRGRPAWLVPFAPGDAVGTPEAGHLEALGAALARFHLAAAGLRLGRSGAHQGDVLCPLAERWADALASTDPELARLLASEAEFQRSVPEKELPGGVIHSDLFLDNLLFQGEPPRVSAFLDFCLAGEGPWLFDLAVVLSDAGWSGSGISGERARALLGGYRAVRPLLPLEFELLPAYLRRVLLRFLCFRLERFGAEGSRRRPVAGRPKSPAELAAKLRSVRAAHA